MARLKKILLVDDDVPTNFMNKLLIEELDCAENVDVCQTGAEALEYLTTKKNEHYPQPELIFLDINMPVMTGWEFIDEYNKLPIEQQGKYIMMMLTTSINRDDEEKAKESGLISSFYNKPLTHDLLQEILRKYFPELFLNFQD